MIGDQPIRVTGRIGSRQGLRVTAVPERSIVSVKDIAVHIGLSREEAAALARALDQAVRKLDEYPAHTSRPGEPDE